MGLDLAPVAVPLVRSDARGVGHRVGDEVLLSKPREQVRHGAGCVDGHVLASVGLVLQGDEDRIREVVCICKETTNGLRYFIKITNLV